MWAYMYVTFGVCMHMSMCMYMNVCRYGYVICMYVHAYVYICVCVLCVDVHVGVEVLPGDILCLSWLYMYESMWEIKCI